MDFGLKDRVALVAAASRGIGFAAARELAREGARVFLCSRDEERASEAAQKIHEETGANVAGIAADVTNEKESEQFVRVALERAGRMAGAASTMSRAKFNDRSPRVSVPSCAFSGPLGGPGGHWYAHGYGPYEW